MGARRKNKNKPTRKHARKQLHKQFLEPEKLPFIAHVLELRKRFFYIAIFVALFGGLAATMQGPLTSFLLKPAGNQQFIYTSPGGGFDFVFRLSLYTGIALSIPVIVYNLLVYLQPLLRKETLRFVIGISLWSSLLASMGILYGYFVGMPPGLHFLLQSFSSEQIKALIGIDKYLSFVLTYLLGSALLFQIPLVLILINRIKPLQPKKLMGYQRWVILAAFSIGAIISPSPDLRNQAIMSGPIILMYEISIIIIWALNRKNRRPKRVVELLRKDAEIQAGRLANFEKAQAMWQQTIRNTVSPVASSATSKQQYLPASSRTDRPRQYLEKFSRRPSRSFMG